MTVNKFIETYSEKNLLGDGLSIGTTSLRNHILANKESLEKDNIVKYTKKISSVRIDIEDPEGLYKKLA